jgi:hypothetical protein
MTAAMHGCTVSILSVSTPLRCAAFKAAEVLHAVGLQLEQAAQQAEQPLLLGAA